MTKRLLIALLIAIAILAGTTAIRWFMLPPAVRAQTNTFCAANLACTVSAAWTYSSTLTVTGANLLTCRLENVRFIDAANSCGWAGTDFGSWFNSAQSDCPASAPNGCVVDARSFTGNVTNGTAFTVGTSRPTSLLLGSIKMTTSQTITIQQLSSVIGLPTTDTDGSANLPVSTIFQANTTNLACLVDFVGNLGTLRDVLVDGNKANNATATNDGVCVHNARAVIERVSSARNQRHGIHIISTGLTNQAQGTKIFHSTGISNNGSGIRCDASTDLFITNGGESENNSLWGIDNFDCSGMRVVGPNDIGGNGSGGIQIQGISTGWKAVNNLVVGVLFGNQLGPDIFVEGGCSDNLTLLCSRSHTITGNVFIGLGASAAANTFDAVKIQDSANNAITGNVFRSASPASYKYGLELASPNRAEGTDTIAGNNIDATNNFGTGFFLPIGATMCSSNNDPANLCAFKIAAFYGAPDFRWAEAAAPGGIAAYDIMWGDSTAHRVKFNNNNGGVDFVVGAATTDTLTNKTLTTPVISSITNTGTLTLPTATGTLADVIASGTSTMASGSISAATCATAITTAATNTATTDTISWAYATAPTLTTDALLDISPYVTAGNVNFTRCNPTAGAIVGTAIVINWRVIR